MSGQYASNPIPNDALAHHIAILGKTGSGFKQRALAQRLRAVQEGE